MVSAPVVPVKRKRERPAAPAPAPAASASSTSAAAASTSKAAAPPTPPTWSELLSSLQGSKGEAAAVQALNQLARILTVQAASASATAASKKPADANQQIWTSFLSYWSKDPGLKDVVAVWERGDESGNQLLTVAALSLYSTVLSISVLPSAGIISLDSPYQSTLSALITELIPLLHHLTKHLTQLGKNELTTASLELVASLLKIVRHSPARNSTSRKIWTALNLEPKTISRLLSTRRKIPLVTRQGVRKPDIRHLMLSVLLNLLSPSASASIKTDLLAIKGLITCIWKTLHEDPREAVESVLETMAYLVASDKLSMEIRCRIAEDSWAEVLRLYERTEETDADGAAEGVAYSPGHSAHRYLLHVVGSLANATPLSPHQRKALGALLGALQISDSDLQADVALHILASAPDMLPSFWARFAHSLEPRLSSRWVTSIGFAGRVIAAPVAAELHAALLDARTLAAPAAADGSAKLQSSKRRLRLPNMGILLDAALPPAALGKTWLSKALQTSSTTPLVSFLACNFLYIGLRKILATLEIIQHIVLALKGKPDAVPWQAAADKMRTEAKERVPDLQVLIALVQNGLGRAFSRAGSVASSVGPSGELVEDGEPVQEDNTMLLSLALRTIALYHAIVPSAFSNLRFDFGRLLSSSFFQTSALEAIPIAALGQAALLELVSSPGDAETGEGAITWSWAKKSSEAALSPLASIIDIYLSEAALPSLRDVAERTAMRLLGSSVLFEHAPSEGKLWLEAVPRGVRDEQLAALIFLDGCIQRCLATPFKYLDQLQSQHNSTDRCNGPNCGAASPLLATVSEQLQYRLEKAEDATPYATFVQRLVIAMGCNGPCLCTPASLVRQVLAGLEQIKGQKGAVQILIQARSYLALLHKGTPSEQNSSMAPWTADTSDPLALLYASLDALATGGPMGMQTLLSKVDDAAIAGSDAQLARLALFALDKASKPAQQSAAIACLNIILSRSSAAQEANLKTLLFSSPQLLDYFKAALAKKGTAGQGMVDLLGRHLKEPTLVALLVPYAQVLISDESQLHQIEKLVPFLPAEEAVSALEALLAAQDRASALAKPLCTRIATLALTSAQQEAVASQWQLLLGMGEEGVALLVSLAEASLPTGLLPLASPARFSTAITAKTKQPWVAKAATALLQQGLAGLSITSSRLVAIAIYQEPTIASAFASAAVLPAQYSNTAPALLAFVESLLNIPEDISQLRDLAAPAASAFLAAGDSMLRAYSAAFLLRLQCISPALSHAVVSQLADKLPAAASASPTIFDRLSVDTFSALSARAAGVEAFAALETLVNESMKWLVRRFAEDAENTPQVDQYIGALGVCLKANTGRWLLKPHLVEPVVTAGVQNRLSSAGTVSFIASLLQEVKLQPAVQSRLLQGVLADSRLRAGLAPSPATARLRLALVHLLEAFHRHSPELLGQLGAFSTLLAHYGGSVSPADQSLLRIFRLAELRGQTSFRSLVRQWVPAALRGVATGTFQVLSAMDPAIIHGACVRILQRPATANSVETGSTPVGDPAFFLPLLAVLLDSEEITRTSWLSLAESGLLGLAICALSSANKQYQLAADRTLAKVKNALQSSSDFREKDELTYLLDSVKNLIIPSAASDVLAVPPLVALFLAKGITGMGNPGDWEYPLIWRFLLSRPIIDTKDVPLFYNLFFSSSENSARERRWLVQMLTDGTHTSDDWRILRRRQVVELFLSFLQSGVADEKNGLRLDILRFFARITALPSAAQDLVSRHGFFSSLSLLRPLDGDESALLVRTIDNCVSGVQPSKLRRARDGLWVVDALKALETAWPATEKAAGESILPVVAHTLRRSAAYLATGGQEAAIRSARPSLVELSARTLHGLQASSAETEARSTASSDLCDAIIRLDCIAPSEASGSLLEAMILLNVRLGNEVVREELIRCWHAKE